MSTREDNEKPIKKKRVYRTPAQAAADQERYLEVVAKTGVLLRSVEAVEGLSWSTVQHWRRVDQEFEERLQNARTRFGERLEQEAIRRGALGVDKPVFWKGRQVATVKRYSDRLLELLLKKTNPEFRDKITADVHVRGGVLVVPGVAPTISSWAEETGALIDEPDGDEALRG